MRQRQQVQQQPEVPRRCEVLQGSVKRLRGGGVQGWHPCSYAAGLVCAWIHSGLVLMHGQYMLLQGTKGQWVHDLSNVNGYSTHFCL